MNTFLGSGFRVGKDKKDEKDEKDENSKFLNPEPRTRNPEPGTRFHSRVFNTAIKSSPRIRHLTNSPDKNAASATIKKAAT